MDKLNTRLRYWLFFTVALLMLSGCSQLVVFDSKGPVGITERNIIIKAFCIMLIVVIPVIIMSLWFAYRYRETNQNAVYDPNFTHSTQLEFVLWGIPIIIVLFLAVIAYRSSHELDPYKPLESEVKPVTIEAVALNWKWLFIYPDLGIATVNEIVFPKEVPVNFKITSDAPMNSFFIPQLGGQIYAMAGMQTKLHLLAHHAGNYRGMSSNYSGAGFANMHFQAIATETNAELEQWVDKVKAAHNVLDDKSYQALAKDDQAKNEQAERNNLDHHINYYPVTYFSTVKPNLFRQIMGQYAGSMHNTTQPMQHNISAAVIDASSVHSSN